MNNIKNVSQFQLRKRDLVTFIMVYREPVNTCVIRTREKAMEWDSAKGEYAAFN